MNNGNSTDQPLKILHIEDSPMDAEIIREKLIDGGLSIDIDWAANENEFARFLQSGMYDIIIADYHLPGFEAPEALALVLRQCPEVPFICVSGAVGEEKAVALLKQGATDYVSKKKLDNLQLAIRRALDEVKERAARKLAEEALLKSEERHRTILQTAMDGFWLVDMQERILEVNETYCRMSGYSAQELLAKRITDLEVIENQQETAARIRKLVDQGEDRFESRHRRKDGSTFDIEVSVQYQPVDGGQMVVFMQDISDHRKLEEQLRQSQKMEAIGQLAGGVAHDFNNILTVILGYANLLSMKVNFSASEKEAMQHIVSAAEKAAQLTQGLLAFSRKQVMDSKPVNLNDIVQQMQKFLVRIIGEDIRLRAVHNDATLSVLADAGQIEQVLINLAANARDAMSEGGELTIETSFQTIDDSFVHEHNCGKVGNYALISVSDNGCGMDETTCTRIFEPFFTTKEVGKGTGLGMAIVHGIVSQHNGFIYVYSEQGKGTTFKIFIPIIDKELLTEMEHVAEKAPKGGTETILVVEDDVSVRKVMESILIHSGYEIISAGDGVDAVKMFSENSSSVKLILMDMIMPKKSGLEAYKEIKQIQAGAKVLFTSGYTADFLRNRGELDKGADLILKPVKPLELLRKMREMLDRKEND
ncbi:MAG: response regulator [Desulfuromonadaceae bacterium]|nr:response regulator [Desulfuromonadaceae bacterium]MDD5106649.1 response regulator [Desulfuromonadaceae bacterium]